MDSGAIDSRVAATPEEKDALDAWFRQSFAPEYAKLGPPSDSDSQDKKQLRALLFLHSVKPRISRSSRRHVTISAKYLAGHANSIDPNLAQTALQVSARNGDAALFDQLRRSLKRPPIPKPNRRSASSPCLKILSSLSVPGVRSQARVRTRTLRSNSRISLDTDKNRDLAWKFIQTHWDEVKKEFTPRWGPSSSGNKHLLRLNRTAMMYRSSSPHTRSPMPTRELKHAIERINGCIELRNLQEPQLKSWLASQPKTSTSETAH